MITKEKFVYLMKFIKEQAKKENNFVNALEELSPGTFCDCFLFDRYETELIKLIQEDLHDDEDDIGYFLYEMNYLQTDKFDEDVYPTDSKDRVLYTSVETLYDYLVKKMTKKRGRK